MVLPHAEALLVAIGKTGSRTGSKGAPPSNAATRFHWHPWGHDGHVSEGNASANARKLALCERTASEKWHPTYLGTLTDLMSEMGHLRRFGSICAVSGLNSTADVPGTIAISAPAEPGINREY
jgi:hypothetical protein